VGDEVDRHCGDLRLRVLQVLLVVPAVQLRRDPARRAPPPSEKETPEAEAHVLRTARLFAAAGRHFNHGTRAFSSRSDISAGSSARWC